MIEFHRYRISGCTSTIENMDAKMFVEMCAVSIFPQTRQSESDEITLLVTWNIRVLLLIIILDTIRLDTGFRAFFRSFFSFSLLYRTNVLRYFLSSFFVKEFNDDSTYYYQEVDMMLRKCFV